MPHNNFCICVYRDIILNPGIEPRSPALQVDSLPAEPQRKPKNSGVGGISLLQQIFPTDPGIERVLPGSGLTEEQVRIETSEDQHMGH